MLAGAKPQMLPPFLISSSSLLLGTVLAQNTLLKKEAVQRQRFGLGGECKCTAWFQQDVSF